MGTARSRRPHIAGVCSLLLALAIPVHVAGQECPGPTRTFDLARVQQESVVLRGPVKLVFEGLNRLRHDIVLGQEITLADAEDLSVVPFFPVPAEVATEDADPAAAVANTRELPPEQLPAVSLQALEGTQQARKTALERLEDHVDAKVRSIDLATQALAGEVNRLTAAARTSREALLDCSQRFDDLVDESDSYLRNGGADALAAEVQEVLGCITPRRPQLRWPEASAIASVRGRIETQKKELGELHFLPGFASWHGKTENAKRYAEVSRRIESLLSALAPLGPEGDSTKAFRQGMAALGERERLLRSLVDWQDRAAPFRLSHCVPCGFPRFRTQETKVTLVQTERFPAQGKDAAVVKSEVVTVVCPSRFAVATGIGFAQVDEKTFELVQSLPDPPAAEGVTGSATDGNGNGDGNGDETVLVKRISAKTTSDPTVAATAVIHTELWSWVGDLWDDPKTRRSPNVGLHFTAGAALQLDGGSETPLGYLAGLSVSLQERLFLTAGWQFHRVTKLAGGFEEGQQVPDELAAPPTRTEWDSGFAFAVTYRPRS